MVCGLRWTRYLLIFKQSFECVGSSAFNGQIFLVSANLRIGKASKVFMLLKYANFYFNKLLA